MAFFTFGDRDDWSKRQRAYELAMAQALRTPAWAHALQPIHGIYELKTPAKHTLRLDARGDVWTLGIVPQEPPR